MSVQCNTYVIVGTKLPFPELTDSDPTYHKYEKWCDSAYKPRKKGMVCLFDGMNGEYIVLGHVVASTGNWEPFEKPISASVSKEVRESVKEELTRLFGLVNPTVKTWIVSHYR